MFTFHWYAGALPPFVGVAENVTNEPEHTLVAEAVIASAGVTIGLTVMVIVLLVAVVANKQVALLVSVHFTTSPFKGV